MPKTLGLLRYVLLAMVTAGVYSRVATHGFLSYDDLGYVTRNALVTGGLTAAGALGAFTSAAQSNWHPVTWLSHMLDVQLFGLNAGAHHLVNVALHALAAVLLCVWLTRATARPWCSLAVAALFALHPLRVESVAWISERKDVLSGVFWQLSLLAYVSYARKPSLPRYAMTLAIFGVGLLTKPMLVTLPVILLLVDVWPLARAPWAAAVERRPGGLAVLTRQVGEKIPFACLSLASAAVTVWAQRNGGSLVDLQTAPLGLRAANALCALASYLGKTVWPADLAVFYPLPFTIPAWKVLLSATLIVGVTAVAFLARKSRPYLMVGWLWFLITMVPVIGLVQVGAQAMADRYTYLPSIGLGIMIVWGLADLAGHGRVTRAATASLTATVVAVLCAATYTQLGYWKDSLTLYERTLAVTEGNYIILENYGTALGEARRTNEAIRALEEAIVIAPGRAQTYFNLAVVLHPAGHDPEGARAMYERAIQLKPRYMDAHLNLGALLYELGRPSEALDVLLRARQLASSERPDLVFNIGLAHLALGHTTAARHEAAVLDRVDSSLAQRLRELIER